ncbi:hypothetical protein GTW51_20305 [Aurantimonas aggregata]|uniref:DUF3060 domain-containing protein n=1 Tax=Aurantimonas aggregata TaxID=2047720 RepID=A0A6L9MMH7_9HYPH|nr:hypothetical protein [Aurantimonas aggregata]NDV89023.1 hypothetical protein [Aurantimonas aggregata]
MKFLKFALMTSATAMFATAGLAQERAPQQLECGCSSQPLAASAGATLGVVTSATSDVLMSQPAGLAAAKAGAPLSLGSRVVAGPKGSAALSLGSDCLVNVAANSAVTVAASEGKLCVRTATVTQFESTTRFGQQQGPGDQQSPSAPIGFPEVAGGLIGVAAAASVITGVSDDDDDESVSLGR